MRIYFQARALSPTVNRQQSCEKKTELPKRLVTQSIALLNSQRRTLCYQFNQVKGHISCLITLTAFTVDEEFIAFQEIQKYLVFDESPALIWAVEFKRCGLPPVDVHCRCKVLW